MTPVRAILNAVCIVVLWTLLDWMFGYDDRGRWADRLGILLTYVGALWTLGAWK